MSEIIHRIEFRVMSWYNVYQTIFTYDSLITMDSQEPIFNSAG